MRWRWKRALGIAADRAPRAAAPAPSPVPEWEIRLAGRVLAAPLESPLRRIYALTPEFNAFIGRFTKYLRSEEPGFAFLDIGANLGDTAVLALEGGATEVLCIEGDPEILPYLIENVGGDARVRLIREFVGEREGEIDAGLMNLGGNLCIRTSQADVGLAVEKIRMRTLDAVLSEVAGEGKKGTNGGAAIRLVKLDVEGFEPAVLEGGRGFFAREKPVLALEWSAEERGAAHLRDDLAPRLAEIGYEVACVYDNRGVLLCAGALDDPAVADIIGYASVDGRSIPYHDLLLFANRDAGLFRGFAASERAYRAALKQAMPRA